MPDDHLLLSWFPTLSLPCPAVSLVLILVKIEASNFRRTSIFTDVKQSKLILFQISTAVIEPLPIETLSPDTRSKQDSVESTSWRR